MAEDSHSRSRAAQVVFTPSGRRGRFPAGTKVLDAARALGVDLDSVCGGRGICGRCQVVQSIGEFPKHGVASRADHLSEFGPIEQRYHDKRAPLAPGHRLGCSTEIRGDVVIDVPPDSQVHRQVVRKRAEVHAIRVDPVVRLHFIEVAPPDMHEPAGDLRRVEAALREEWGVEGVRCDLAVLETLQTTLRSGGWRVTVAVHGGRDVIGVWAGLPGQGIRGGGGRRLDHHRGASVRALVRRGRRLGRRDESANPVRRGPHEPGLVRDDAPRRRAGDDRGGARCDPGACSTRRRPRPASRRRRSST